MRAIARTAAAFLVSVSAVAAGQGAAPDPAQRHLDAARALAANDMTAIADGYLCRAPQEANAYLAPILANKADPAPAAAFDNLYYVGGNFVGVWILKTPAGLVLIDAMWNDGDAIKLIEPGMRQLGLDPAEIRHVLITHGHVDHYGGAHHFQTAYGAKIWASAADWDVIVADPHPMAKGVVPPARDQVAADGAMLEFGGETIRFVTTPGHTPGTLSLVLTAKDGGKPIALTLWGGTAMPENSAGVRQMHASLLKLWQAGEAAGAEGEISTHAFVDDGFGRFERKAGAAANPFALGRDGYARAMGIQSECILAQAARYEAQGK